MNGTVANIALILLFTLIGGIFAAAEMSLVSLRESQIKSLSHRGTRGATVARLAANPNRFLSAVQIGVTLSGFLSAAFGGATLQGELSPVLQRWGLSTGVADAVALVGITVVISYLSIVLGELTAKRLALQRSEGFALALAPLVDLIATLARPVIWLLGASTNIAVRVLGGDPRASREEVTDEEIRSMVSTSLTLGAEERRIMDELFSAGERSLREVMVPRTEVDFLAGDTPIARAVRDVKDAPHSRYPVTGQSTDDVIGFVHVRDLFDPDVASGLGGVQQLMRPVIALPDTVRILPALTEMRRRSAHLAVVRDEYGGTAGIVTMEDLVEELVGEINDEYDVVLPAAPATADTEVDGLTTLEEFAERFGLQLDDGPYDTVAGWFMAQQGRLPQVEDEVEVELASAGDDPEQSTPVRFRVLEVDGRRASRIRVLARSAVPGDEGPAGTSPQPGTGPGPVLEQ